MKSKIKEHLKKFTLFSVLSFIGIVSLISLLLSNPEENNFFKFDSLSKDSENLFNIFFSTMSDFLFNSRSKGLAIQNSQIHTKNSAFSFR